MKKSTPTYGDEYTYVSKTPFFKVTDIQLGSSDGQNKLLKYYYEILQEEYNVIYPKIEQERPFEDRVLSIRRSLEKMSDTDYWYVEGKKLDKHLVLGMIPKALEQHREIKAHLENLYNSMKDTVVPDILSIERDLNIIHNERDNKNLFKEILSMLNEYEKKLYNIRMQLKNFPGHVKFTYEGKDWTVETLLSDSFILRNKIDSIQLHIRDTKEKLFQKLYTTLTNIYQDINSCNNLDEQTSKRYVSKINKILKNLDSIFDSYDSYHIYPNHPFTLSASILTANAKNCLNLIDQKSKNLQMN